MKPLILLPTRSAVSIETMLCINEHLDGACLLTAYRLPVATARNVLAKWARESDEPYVLWVDDDCWFTREHVETALSILQENATVDMVTAMASRRYAYSDSNVTTNNGSRKIAPMSLNPGELAAVDTCGFHFVMMRRSQLERLGNCTFTTLPMEDPDMVGCYWPEDFSFCRRVHKIGGQIVTEKSLVVGHVEVVDGLMYFPLLPPVVANGSDRPFPLPKDHTRFRTREIPRNFGMFVNGKPELNAA
jgi:hypothetical protein